MRNLREILLVISVGRRISGSRRKYDEELAEELLGILS